MIEKRALVAKRVAVGAVLEECFRSKGFNNNQIARHTGLAPTQVHSILRGDSCFTIDSFAMILDFAGLNIVQLVADGIANTHK